MNEEQLRSKKVGELREIAAAFGIADTGKMKKAEILEALLNFKQNESEISEQSIPSEPEQIPENNDFNLTNNDTDTSESDVFASAPEIVVSESQIPDEPVKRRVPDEVKETVEGILEMSEGNNFGFLRFHNFLTSDSDVYVSPAQIRRFRLKTGDKVKGITRPPNEGEKFRALLYVNTVNGDPLNV
ncbi:MAG: Rho termination factor N-terminal domain-containing protein, partial [Firmicutes bacterium]|nr:Rho termination factor N-terminal domain-containing protein [Bacillota bacterium]